MSAIVVYQRNMLAYGYDLDNRHMIQTTRVASHSMLVGNTVVDIYDVVVFGEPRLVAALAPLILNVTVGIAGVNDTLTPLAESLPGLAILLRARDELWVYRGNRWQPVPPKETYILGTPDIQPIVPDELRANTQVSPYLILRDLVDSKQLGKAHFQIKSMD